MKKGLIGIIFLSVLTLGGCHGASDTFLAYQDNEAFTGSLSGNLLNEGDFFADDIAVVTMDQNNGEDERITSGAALLINISDNKVIYADNVYDNMYPASLTKLLTALVVLHYGELTDQVTVHYNAVHIPERDVRVCGYQEGDVISLEALLYSLLVYSGNDAAIAAAEHISGNEEAFVKLMNQEALKIGAVDSNFMNSHGLHNDNQNTTAYDMYLIFNKLVKYDTFRTIISTKSYTAEYTDADQNAKQKTLNTVNSYISGQKEPISGMEILGGLSGATSKAGYCLILLCKDSNGNEYISILLNAPDNDSLYAQMNDLLSLAIEE